MITKILKFYNNMLFCNGFNCLLMASPYPIISGWLLSKVGVFWSSIYFIVIITMMVTHGLFIAKKLFPGFRLFDDK